MKTGHFFHLSRFYQGFGNKISGGRKATRDFIDKLEILWSHHRAGGTAAGRAGDAPLDGGGDR